MPSKSKVYGKAKKQLRRLTASKPRRRDLWLLGSVCRSVFMPSKSKVYGKAKKQLRRLTASKPRRRDLL